MIEFFPDMKTFLRIGDNITIAWYAVFIMTGAFIAYYLSLRQIKRMGYKQDDLDDLFVGALIFGILGARIWYVLFSDLSYYLQDPISIIRIQDGGLAIHGGLLAGIGYGYYFTKKRGINFMHWADAIVPNILVAQAMGRWGNFMNQEAFGGIVDESHFRLIPDFIKNNMFIDGAYRAPTFLYESVLNLIGWLLITRGLRKSEKLKRGDQSFAYLMWYGVVRFVIESMRTDALLVNLGFVELRIAQVISIVFVVVGLIGFYGGFRKFYPKTKPALIFDFDGTIMDTQDLIFETYIRVFEKHDPSIELTEEILYSFLGPTLYDSFGRFFPDEKLDILVDEYRTLNLELHDQFVKPKDHIIEVLDILKEKGYTMGIVSSKMTHPIEHALELTNMSHYFEFVYGVDKYEKVKPDPEGILKAMDDFYLNRSSFIYLGDTETDVVAGRKAGAFTVAYVADDVRRNTLVNSNPNVVIEDWRDLLEVLEGDHEWTYNLI